MATSWTLKRWGEMYGVPESAYEVAAGVRSVEAVLYHNPVAGPLCGLAVLLSSHIFLTEGASGRALFWVALRAVTGMRCTERVLIPGKSFGCPMDENTPPIAADEMLETATVARKVISLDIFTAGAAVTMKLVSSRGEQLARALLAVWSLCHGGAKSLPMSLCHPGDAVYAVAGAPIRLSATVVQCTVVGEATSYDAGEVVDIVMLDENEVWLVRKPGTAIKFWRDLSSGTDGDLERLPVRCLSLLAFPSSTSLRLVGCRGDVYLFEIPDAADDPVAQQTLQRMTELFLISLLSSHCCCTAPDSSSWLRYSDLVAFYRQYTSMDTEGIGYVLHSSLEAAMGPLLSCDSRLVQAMCFSHKGKHNKDDPTCGEKTVSLAVYINLMRILLKGSIAERATIAFRAFGGGSSNNNNSHFNAPSGGNEHDEAEDYVRSSDFKLIARDILFGLGFNPSKENEKIDDVVNSILLEAHGGGGSEIGASMSYPVFLLAYTLLVERLGLDAKREDGTARMCGVPPPLLLGFGTAQWVPLTYAMAGVEASVRAAMGGGGGGEKNTFDLSHGTPTIAGVVSIPQIGAVGAASKFLHKRIPALHGDRVTFADYAPATFAALRQRFGTDADTFLDAVGISALRAHLLLGRLYVPRDFRSSGRSGALLLSSHNHHFILKRISFAESRTLRRLLPAYVAHVHRHPHSLLQRFAGLYALTRGGEKSSFIIVENVFAEAQLPIAAVYDLKGSTVHRTTSAEERRSGAAGKDNDFLADKKQLHLSTEARDALLVQLEADTKLLEEANTLDYSLILGIHISDGGFASSKKSITLSTQQKQGMRELTVTLDEHRKQEAPDGPNNSVFRAYYGGVPSIDGTEVYYFGIVDCLTAYGLKKVGEHYGKSMLLHDMKEVSCVPPPDYRSRLMNFVRSILVE